MLDEIANDFAGTSAAITSNDAVATSDSSSTSDLASDPQRTASDGASDSAKPGDSDAAKPAGNDTAAATTPVVDPAMAQLLAGQVIPLATNTTPADASSPGDVPVTPDETPPAATTPAADSKADSGKLASAARDGAKPAQATAPDPADVPSADTTHTAPAAGEKPILESARRDPADDARRDRADDLQPPDASPAVSTPPASTDTADDTANAAALLAAALPTTNQAASPVVTNGATVKPAKAANAVSSSDSSKNETRSSKASALADAGDVLKRGFANEPAVRAALPVQGKATGDSAPQPDSAAQPPQHNAANPATLAVPVQQQAAADAVQPAAAPAVPAHAQAAPAQPDPGVNITTVNTGPSATQTAAAATPAHLAAQIQVSHQAPDINALAVNIAARSADGQRHFDIRLDPADLGRVDVRLSVDDAGKAQAVMSVEKPQTLELLQKDSAHLERALKDAGLDLSQNGLSFSLKGQQHQHAAQDHTPFARSQRLSAHALATVDDMPPIFSSSGVSTSDTRLDIRV